MDVLDALDSKESLSQAVSQDMSQEQTACVKMTHLMLAWALRDLCYMLNVNQDVHID